jgi:hypothetical protein
MMLRRALPAMVVSAAAVVAALVVVPLAGADRPTIQPLPDQSFTDPTCGFNVLVNFSSNEKLKVFSSGKAVVTGRLTATYSANGKTLTFNASGPTTIGADGSFTAQGVGVGDVTLPDGSVTIARAAGTVTIGPASGAIILEHGTVLTDICAALAGP